MLLDNFGIETDSVAQNKAKGQYITGIPKRQVGKVQSLVKAHMPSSMTFRVGL